MFLVQGAGGHGWWALRLEDEALKSPRVGVSDGRTRGGSAVDIFVDASINNGGRDCKFIFAVHPAWKREANTHRRLYILEVRA